MFGPFLFCFLLIVYASVAELQVRWITSDQFKPTIGVPTFFSFKSCMNYSASIPYEATVFSPQSYPGSGVPVLLGITVSDSNQRVLCAHEAQSQVSCTFNLDMDGTYTITIDPLFDGHYQLAVNVQAKKSSAAITDQRVVPERSSYHRYLADGSDPSVIPLSEIFETTLGPVSVDYDRVASVTFGFCTRQPNGASFVITGAQLTTEVRTVLCPPYVSVAKCFAQPIAQVSTTAQTQVLTTSHLLSEHVPYQLIFVGRGYNMVPPSVANIVFVQSSIH